MAEKKTKTGRYAAQDIESLRAAANRKFIIRPQPEDGKHGLAGLRAYGRSPTFQDGCGELCGQCLYNTGGN